MAKKRKASGRQSDEYSGPSMDAGTAKKRIRTYEDVADSDDEFHINRDKVLLDEAPAAKRRRRDQEREEFLEPSDEEVLGYSVTDDEEEVDDIGEASQRYDPDGLDSDSDDVRGADLDDDEEGVEWDLAKDEIYGADEIETEEQALAEEAEALRLQRKQLQAMTAADYGFDENEWQTADVEELQDEDKENVVTEVLPQLQISDDMGAVERLKILKSRYPEFEHLSKELLSVSEIHASMLEDLNSRTEIGPHGTAKLRAASAYIGALTMYFALLCSPASTGEQGVVAMSAAQLRDHPVMNSLLECRELWIRAKRLPSDSNPQDQHDAIHPQSNGDELPQASDQPETQRPIAKKSRAQRNAEAAQAVAEARRAERIKRTEADFTDLDALIAPSKSRRSMKSKRSLDEDLGEEAPLTSREAAEKANRKKSLRFYTSQIAQKANKRGTAGRNAGGDDDIPYRERLKDRQARLNAEAEKRGQRDTSNRADLGGESDEEDTRQAQQVSEDGEDDYYDLVAARTAKKKSEKAALAEAREQAALASGRVIPAETVGPDGKRRITYAIEKNKGLTPHRKKDVRNPRVKKRKKFDEKNKKLGSIKAVYKGGEGRGGYGGELTGIKKSVVKSVKL